MSNTFLKIVYTLFLLPNIVLAQVDTAQSVIKDPIVDLFEMDLEQLINLKVVVSSKKEMSASEAPGIITAYSSKHIEQFGYFTLNQLADITPGYGSFQVFGERVYETRGRRAGSFDNNKHLTLIDGIPFNFTRNYKSPTQNDLPLFFADKVEFLKGPASALYGNAAYYGVVSVSSKDLSKENINNEVRLSGGNTIQERRIHYSTGKQTKKGSFNFNYGYYSAGQSGDFLGHDSLGIDSLYRNWDDENSSFIYTKYTFEKGKSKGLTLGLLYSNKVSGLGEFWWGPSSMTNELTWQSMTPFIKYNRTKGNWTLNSYLKGQSSYENGKYAALQNPSLDSSGNFNNTSHRIFSEYNSNSGNLEAFGELSGDLGHEFKIRIGLNYDGRREQGTPRSYAAFLNSADSTNPSYEELITYENSLTFHTISSFLHLEKNISFLNGLSLIGGIREDFGYTSLNQYVQFSPRLGLVQKINKTFTYKLLYGSALRAPGIKEVGLNQETMSDLESNNQSGDFIKSISAETFQSLESSLVYSKKSITSSLTGYKNRSFNSLDGISNNNVNYFINSSTHTTVYGFEFDLNAVVNKNLYITLSHSSSFLEDSIIAESNYTQTSRTNIGLSYQFNGKVSPTITIINRYIYGYRYFDIDEYSNTPAFNIMDMNILVPLSKTIRLEAQVRNVLESDYSQPGINGARYDIPGKKRAFLLSLYSNF